MIYTVSNSFLIIKFFRRHASFINWTIEIRKFIDTTLRLTLGKVYVIINNSVS